MVNEVEGDTCLFGWGHHVPLNCTEVPAAGDWANKGERGAGRSNGKLLLKCGLTKLENKMAEQRAFLGRMTRLYPWHKDRAGSPG